MLLALAQPHPPGPHSPPGQSPGDINWPSPVLTPSLIHPPRQSQASVFLAGPVWGS